MKKMQLWFLHTHLKCQFCQRLDYIGLDCTISHCCIFKKKRKGFKKNSGAFYSIHPSMIHLVNLGKPSQVLFGVPKLFIFTFIFTVFALFSKALLLYTMLEKL